MRGWRLSSVWLLGVLLSGCGTHIPSADAVQQQCIAAIRANDQPALQHLVAPTARYTVADIPTTIYNATVDPNYKLGYKPTGPFQRVEIQQATPRGAAMVSKSIWHWAAAVECFDTTLATFPEGWQVMSIYRSDTCP